MNLVNWKCDDFKITMIDIDGELFCTGKMLADVLNIDADRIRYIYKRHKDEFSIVSKLHDRKQLNTLLGYRLGNRTKLWSEEDMILISVLSKSRKSKEFRKNIIKVIKERARTGMVSKEEFEKLAADTKKELDEIKSFLKGAKSTFGRFYNLDNRIKNVSGNVIEGAFNKRSNVCL